MVIIYGKRKINLLLKQKVSIKKSSIITNLLIIIQLILKIINPINVKSI